MRKHVVPIILICGIMAVLAVSGCTEVSNVVSGTTNIGDINRDPESYLGKSVTIEGFYRMASGYREGNVSLTKQIVDDQGYEIPIVPLQESGRTISLYFNYRVTGVIKASSVDTCICQNQNSWTGEWSDYIYSPERTVEECEGMYLSRCKSGSFETPTNYYLEVTEPMVKL